MLQKRNLAVELRAVNHFHIPGSAPWTGPTPHTAAANSSSRYGRAAPECRGRPRRFRHFDFLRFLQRGEQQLYRPWRTECGPREISAQTRSTVGPQQPRPRRAVAPRGAGPARQLAAHRPAASNTYLENRERVRSWYSKMGKRGAPGRPHPPPASLVTGKQQAKAEAASRYFT